MLQKDFSTCFSGELTAHVGSSGLNENGVQNSSGESYIASNKEEINIQTKAWI